MIAYNKKGLENLRLQQSAKNWRRHRFIDDTELTTIIQRNPHDFFIPGIFLRIGLFVLGWIIISTGFGLLSAMLASAQILDSFIWPLVVATLVILLSELFIREKKHFRSGIDDAARWIAFGLLIGSLYLLIVKLDKAFYEHNYGLTFSCFIFITSAGFMLRYADRVMAAVSSIAFFAMVLFLCHKAGRYGDILAPFVGMIVAAAAYFVTRKQGAKLGDCYTDCVLVIELICATAFYAAGNYLVIDKLNQVLNPSATKVAFAPLFWGWTFVIPAAYVYFGIVKKDRLLLRLGLVLIAAAIYTFRTYFHVMSIEVALVLAGGILCIASYLLIRYLGNPRNGFIYREIDVLEGDVINVEDIASAAIANPAAKTHQPAHDRFGGGDFGGGGSGGAYQ